MRVHGRLWLLTPAILLIGAALSAQDKPGVDAGAGVDMEITVGRVEGSVEFRTASDKPWAPLEKGMVLKVGAEISTGPWGSVLLLFSDNSEVLVRPLSEMKVEAFHRTETTNVTRIRLKYGSMRESVHKGTRANDFKVKTPSYVMAVTGTEIQESSYWPAYGGNIQMGREGHILVTNDRNVTRGVSAGERTNDQSTSPIIFARLKALIPLPVAGQTKEEVRTALMNDRDVSAFELLRTSTPSNARLIYRERMRLLNRSCEQGVQPTIGEIKPW